MVGGKVFEIKDLVEAFFRTKDGGSESLPWRAAPVRLQGTTRWEVVGAYVQIGLFLILSKGCSSHEGDYFCGNFRGRTRGASRESALMKKESVACASKMDTGAKARLYAKTNAAMKGRSSTKLFKSTNTVFT
jgi:hypothetical protein